MKISVVIPNWNGLEELNRNLPGLSEMKGLEEIIIVDDYSSDSSVNFIKQNFPKIKLIEKNQNSGFSTTTNIGFKQAKGDLILLLNSDAVLKKDTLESALKHFKNPATFSVGANTGGSWSWAKFEEGFFWHFMGPKTDKSHQSLWVSGGSGIFRKKIWDELGGLDEMFNPFYEEDLDIGYRATKRGYINLWEPSFLVEHKKDKGVISSNFSREYINLIAQRNQLIFIWKNIHDKKLIRSHKFYLLKKMLLSPKYAKVFLRALSHIEKIKLLRQEEINKSKLSDKAILEKFS